MKTFRNNLPQCSNQLFLTDGGLETTMIYHHGIDLPQFAAFDLMAHPEGLEALSAYYDTYAGVAVANDLGFIFESVTWRASPDWLEKIGYPIDALERICRDSIDVIVPFRDKYHSDRTPMVISGQLGPRDDGYTVDRIMTPDEAADYHARQVRALAATEADMLSALTLTYAEEAAGIAQAASAVGMPCVISFTVETDGRLPSGQPLKEAVEAVDNTTDTPPAYYMINCAHTTHFVDVLEDADWTRRIRAIRANASCKSHAELNDSVDLDDGDPQAFGSEHAALRVRFPHINILGGCCGTDIRHIRALTQGILSDAA